MIEVIRKWWHLFLVGRLDHQSLLLHLSYTVSNTVLQLLGIEKPSTTRRFQQPYAGKLIRGADMWCVFNLHSQWDARRGLHISYGHDVQVTQAWDECSISTVYWRKERFNYLLSHTNQSKHAQGEKTTKRDEKKEKSCLYNRTKWNRNETILLA